MLIFQISVHGQNTEPHISFDGQARTVCGSPSALMLAQSEWSNSPYLYFCDSDTEWAHTGTYCLQEIAVWLSPPPTYTAFIFSNQLPAT